MIKQTDDTRRSSVPLSLARDLCIVGIKMHRLSLLLALSVSFAVAQPAAEKHLQDAIDDHRAAGLSA